MSIIIFARCEECDHHTELFHLDWYRIVCPNCKAIVKNNYNDWIDSEGEPITIPKYICDQLLEVLDPIYFKDTIITMIHSQLENVVEQNKKRHQISGAPSAEGESW